MTPDLGRRLCDWVLLTRCEPSAPVPAGLLAEIGQTVLSQPIDRHRLPPRILLPSATRWDAEAQTAAVFAFLADDILPLPTADLEAGVATALLVHMGRHWVWRRHAEHDPVTARTYRAFGGAFRKLLDEGAPGVGAGPEGRAKDWRCSGVLVGTNPTARAVTADDLQQLQRAGGWRADLARWGTARSRRALSTRFDSTARRVRNRFASQAWSRSHSHATRLARDPHRGGAAQASADATNA